MPFIVILGTLDTKLNEFLYLHSQVSDALRRHDEGSSKVMLIDCGREPSPDNEHISIKQQDLVKEYGPPGGIELLPTLSRAEAIKFMADCATTCLEELWAMGTESVSTPHAILSAGGSGGTSLAAAVMREAVPIGVPKLIVSTIASGDTGSIVGETDITLMYSVVDIAGTNELLRTILSNAAAAAVGMAAAYETAHGKSEQTTRVDSKIPKTRVGITMFGVTTPCVNRIRQHLEDNYEVEVFVFHATGHGGKAMERLIEEGRLDAVMDITTTEICDHLMGGNMSAGPNRLEAALKAGIPTIISLGATDMTNFGPKDTVPERYKARKLLEHNASVTLMRTSREECREVGEFVVKKILNHATRPTKVELRFPNGGVSMIATPGGVFADAEADEELKAAIRRGLEGSKVHIVEDSRAINDEGFAIDAADSLMRLVNS